MNLSGKEPVSTSARRPASPGGLSAFQQISTSACQCIRNSQDHILTVYKLPEFDSYPIAPSITVIPAKAGIHFTRHSAR